MEFNEYRYFIGAINMYLNKFTFIKINIQIKKYTYFCIVYNDNNNNKIVNEYNNKNMI